MMRLIPAAGFAAISALLVTETAQAAPMETRHEKISLPVHVEPLVTTAKKYPVNSVYWPCPLDTRGTAPNSPSPGFNRVGWTHVYDAGTEPMPCKFRINHVERIVATWDMAPIEKHMPAAFVDSAVLSFDKKRVAGNYECADRFMTVVAGTAPIPPAIEERWDLMVPRLGGPGCVGSRCSVEIKGQMNEWLRRVVPNMGLALIGDQERLDANDNVSCVTEYGNFRLDVSYRYDVAPGTSPSGPMVIPIMPKGIQLLRQTLTVDLVRRGNSAVVYQLRWTNPGAGTVDIVRDGTVVSTTANDGEERDRAPFGTVRYKVCKSGICSNEVAVTG